MPGARRAACLPGKIECGSKNRLLLHAHRNRDSRAMLESGFLTRRCTCRRASRTAGERQPVRRRSMLTTRLGADANMATRMLTIQRGTSVAKLGCGTNPRCFF